MKRREFITLLGGAAALAAGGAGAAAGDAGGRVSQQRFARAVTTLPRVPPGPEGTGYVEGQNLAIEYRWADGQYDRLPAMAAELVRRQVNVIAANSPAPVLAAKAATTTIPIVFATGYDPVAAGLVASLARPGGNLTGVTSLTAEVGPKRLELLHEVVPTATAIAVLVNPAAGLLAETISRDLHAAARTLGLRLHLLHASAVRDFDTVFATLAHCGAPS